MTCFVVYFLAFSREYLGISYILKAGKITYINKIRSNVLFTSDFISFLIKHNVVTKGCEKSNCRQQLLSNSLYKMQILDKSISEYPPGISADGRITKMNSLGKTPYI